jgi:hypothetical protein
MSSKLLVSVSISKIIALAMQRMYCVLHINDESKSKMQPLVSGTATKDKRTNNQMALYPMPACRFAEVLLPTTKAWSGVLATKSRPRTSLIRGSDLPLL